MTNSLLLASSIEIISLGYCNETHFLSELVTTKVS